MDNLDFLLALFNQYLFSSAKENIVDIEYYYNTNPSTRDNTLMKELIYAIKTYNLENIDLPLFQSICSRSGKSDIESKEIVDRFIQWKTFSKDKIEPMRKSLEDLCSGAVISRANNLYPNDPTAYLNYIKKSEVKVNKVQDVLTTSNFSDFDINTLVADESVCGIPSYFDFINRSFEPHRVVEYGQLIMVSMPPGTGKSLFAMTEALNASCRGSYVHYLAMGDLKMSDFIVRLCAIYSGLSFWETRKNLTAIYKSLCEAVGDRLGITCIPAGTLTVDEYVDYIKDTKYKILICDYDSTFKNPGVNDSLYLSFGVIYDKLTELTALGKLVYILAQPQKPSWELEEIELHQIGESAKKIFVCDQVLTRGRCTGSENHLGVFTITKNRRGEEGVKAYSVRLNNGRFRIVPKQVYKDLCAFEGKANWTDADIDGMIANYEKQRAQIESYIQSSNTNNGNMNNLGLTPFGRK